MSTGASALFRSCATPPASVPRLSSRCERSCCRSASFMGVMSSCETTARGSPSPPKRSTRLTNQRGSPWIGRLYSCVKLGTSPRKTARMPIASAASDTCVLGSPPMPPFSQ